MKLFTNIFDRDKRLINYYYGWKWLFFHRNTFGYWGMELTIPLSRKKRIVGVKTIVPKKYFYLIIAKRTFFCSIL